MQMATRTRRWRRADLAQLPDDGNRYEVLDGELLVTPLPARRHQSIVARLIRTLGPYCNRYGLGEALGPGAVVWLKNELQPDLSVIPDWDDSVDDVKWEESPIPVLVVEVLSDSTSRRDLGKKRDAYERLRIHNYWVIDREQRRALIWTSVWGEPTIVTDTIRWQPRGDIPALEIPLDAVLGPRPQ